MARGFAIGISGARAARLALRVTVGTLAAFGVGFGVWLAGFDELWAVAATLAVGAVGGAIATFAFDESARWEAPPRTTPRGTQLAVAMIEQSLAACDRLARPASVRWLVALLNPERDDHKSRASIVRQMRALLVAELHDRGVDPSQSPEAVAALLGPDALAVLQPRDNNPITSAAIARCLEAIDRLALSNPGTR